MNKWRQIRRGIGLTQGQLALVLGVHPITVSKWENDKTTPSPWCAGLMQQFATIPDANLAGGRAKRYLVTDGVIRALYELLRDTDAGRHLEQLEAQGGAF